MIETIETYIDMLDLVICSTVVNPSDLVLNISIVLILCFMIFILGLILSDTESSRNYVILSMFLVLSVFMGCILISQCCIPNYNLSISYHESLKEKKEIYVETVDERKELLKDIDDKLCNISLKTVLVISEKLGSSTDLAYIKIELCETSIEKVREVMQIINQEVGCN